MKLAIKLLISLTLIIASSLAMEKTTPPVCSIVFTHNNKKDFFVGPLEDLFTIEQLWKKQDLTVKPPRFIKLIGYKGS